VAETNDLGKAGENLACSELVGQGYELVARNYRTREGEIDLIFLDGRVLVFVEVKLRKSERLQNLTETISPIKIKRIRKTAENYIEQALVSQSRYDETRFDAFLIKKIGCRYTFEHLKNVF